jgi:hypothetical protein
VALNVAPLFSVAGATICYHRAMPSPRRFPPPWSIDESSAYFTVRDGDRQALAYVYFGNEPGRRSSANSARAPGDVSTLTPPTSDD